MSITCSVAVRWTLCGLVGLAGCGGGAGGGAAAKSGAAEEQQVQGTSDLLKQLVMALHNYEGEQRRLPAACTEANGKPLLSWRVAILPALGEGELYAKFDQSKPWDSPENLPLVKQMPKAFLSPYSPQAGAAGKTTYLAARGPRSALGQGPPVRLEALRDGSSNTLLLVVVSPEHAVEWTKPVDWESDPQPNVQQLQVVPGNQFLAGFADGSVHKVPRDFPAESIRLLVDYGDGKPIFLPAEKK